MVWKGPAGSKPGPAWRQSGRCPLFLGGEGRVPDWRGLSRGLFRRRPGAAKPSESRGGPSVGKRILFPTPSQRARRARARPQPPRAERSGCGGSGSGKRRRKARRGHCYSGTKTHGTGTPGAGERDPPPAAPCWMRAAPGQPRHRAPAGGTRGASARGGDEHEGRARLARREVSVGPWSPAATE
ncbi:uncharacterized protein LOC144616594 [Panthera onca]